MSRRTRPPQGVYSIADLARQEGISEKSARGRLRAYFGGTLVDLGISEWTCGPEDLEFVLSVIRPHGSPSLGHALAGAPPFTADKPTEQNFPKALDPYAWPRKPRNELALPRTSGVYALFLRENSSLPDLVPLDGGLIYLGLGKSLSSRCHFSGKTEGHSPRRSLAALLWRQLELEPELGVNGNYKLSKPSEQRLDGWMHENLLMAFDTFDDFEAVEDILIRRFAPPLNLTKCRQSEQHKVLKDRRKAMLDHAISNHRPDGGSPRGWACYNRKAATGAS